MHNSSFFKTIENIDEDIFYKTCLKSFDKKLILINREDYENENLNKLTVYNYDEAIILLRPNNPIIVQIKGNKNQVSLGDNSPNTNL